MMRSLLFFLSLSLALSLFAVPAKRQRQQLRLHDGSTVMATYYGDEHLHFYEADDGRVFQLDGDEIAWQVDADSLTTVWTERHEKARKVLARRNVRQKSAFGSSSNPIYGAKKGIVILVQFPDAPFHYDQPTIEKLFNERNHKDDINSGSVRDYFYDNSYGQFDFTFDVIGPVTVSQPLSYYGSNDTYGNDIRPATMVAEAVRQIDADVDFTDYDWDGDGKVDQVFVIHSGYDEAQSRRTADIWSHAWTLSEAVDYDDGEGPVSVDGVVVDSYATSAELQNGSGTTLFGIGTACHEFSHCFGLPDTYNTQNSSQFTMDIWDVMDYGEYAGNGGTPVGYTSYERMFCGWLQPTELTSARIVEDMPALTSAPEAYILYNGNHRQEYYLFENRQQQGWDSDLPGHGMLIIHVDFSPTAWAENTVNTVYSHKRMVVVPADNRYSVTSLEGDPWPGSTGNTAFTDTSYPAATLYNANTDGRKLMGHPIMDIQENNGRISFGFDDTIDAISTPTSDAPYTLYNINGQRVGQDYHGLIVSKGKKHLK